MPKSILTENTIISETPASTAKYRAFFKKAIEGFAPEGHCGAFEHWLSLHTGKPLKSAIDDYYNLLEKKNMESRLDDERFNTISNEDKQFIIAFDAEINKIGYDFGGYVGWGACWGRYMIVYSKVGVKSKQVAARIFIRDDCIVLRMFFNNIDKHRTYIENAPQHIKGVFTGTHGDCGCNPRKENCNFRKTYTIDGRYIEKCSGVVFEFHQPDLEKLPDYMGLVKEFYAQKKSARIN
jgi:hypothetical protein